MFENLTPTELKILDRELFMLMIYVISFLIFYFIFVRRARKDALQAQRNQEPQPIADPEPEENIRVEQLRDWKAELAAAKRLTEDDRAKVEPQKRAEFDKELLDKMLKWQNPQEFFGMADDRLNNFAGLVREKYPQLTDIDMQLLMLYALDMPQNDILTLMDYQPSTLPTVKQRLSKKLQLNSAAELTAFINNLLQTL